MGLAPNIKSSISRWAFSPTKTASSYWGYMTMEPPWDFNIFQASVTDGLGRLAAWLARPRSTREWGKMTLNHGMFGGFHLFFFVLPGPGERPCILMLLFSGKNDQRWALWNWVCWHCIMYAGPSGVGCFVIAIWAVAQTKRFDVYYGATGHFLRIHAQMDESSWNWPSSTLSNLAFWRILQILSMHFNRFTPSNMSKS